ncbi:hypothetical protein [Silvanigrella sp.]|jgi:hypothetical protein|uniref:hypothetical protein n=1 Tax=Silvanigrella sp. TaxID=2024976 RepID=UPI0037C9BBDB
MTSEIIVVLIVIVSLFIGMHCLYLYWLHKILKVTAFPYPWITWLTIIPFVGNILWAYLIYKAKLGAALLLKNNNSSKTTTCGFYTFMAFFSVNIVSFFLISNEKAINICSIIVAILYFIQFFQLYRAKKILIAFGQNNS